MSVGIVAGGAALGTLFGGAMGALYGAKNITKGLSSLWKGIKTLWGANGNAQIRPKDWDENYYTDTATADTATADTATAEKEEEEGETTAFPTTEGDGNEGSNEEQPKEPMISNAENEEEAINASGTTPNNEWYELWKNDRNETWAREDAIREEMNEREDTAYQRMVDDMRKAGINPNLVNGSPVATGTGITSATQTQGGAVQSGYGADLSASLTQVTQELQAQGLGQDAILKILSILAMGIMKR